MTSYKYTGDEVREFPTLVLTVNPGDTFDAPADFAAADCVPAAPQATPKATQTPSAPSDTTVGA